MTIFQKLIKLFAIAFAVFIIYAIISLSLSFAKLFSKDNNKELYSFNDIGEFETLNINTKSSVIEIIDDDNLYIETTLKPQYISFVSGKLEIKDSKKISFNDSSKIIIHIPNNTNLKNINIENGGGIINIDNVNLDNLNIEMGAGKISISNSNISNKSKVELGIGLIELNNSSLNSNDIDLGIGKIDIKSSEFFNEINCGIGEITIQEISDSYKLIFEKGIGSIKLNNNEFNNMTYGTGEKNLKISVGIGLIDIK